MVNSAAIPVPSARWAISRTHWFRMKRGPRSAIAYRKNVRHVAGAVSRKATAVQCRSSLGNEAKTTAVPVELLPLGIDNIPSASCLMSMGLYIENTRYDARNVIVIWKNTTHIVRRTGRPLIAASVMVIIGFNSAFATRLNADPMNTTDLESKR